MHALDGPARRDRLGDNIFLRCWLIPRKMFGLASAGYLQSQPQCLASYCTREERRKKSLCRPSPSPSQGGREGNFGVHFLWLGVPCRRNLDWDGAMAEASRAGLGRLSMSHTASLQKQIGHRGVFNTVCDGTEARHPAGWVAWEAAAEPVQGGQGNLIHRVSDGRDKP